MKLLVGFIQAISDKNWHAISDNKNWYGHGIMALPEDLNQLRQQPKAPKLSLEPASQAQLYIPPETMVDAGAPHIFGTITYSWRCLILYRGISWILPPRFRCFRNLLLSCAFCGVGCLTGGTTVNLRHFPIEHAQSTAILISLIHNYPISCEVAS